MKKILLATTMLASTAGFAAADVAVTGSARMGLVHVRTGVVVAAPAVAATPFSLATAAVAANAGKLETQFSSRVRIVFTGTGTTDSGLTFGASMRADQSGGNSTDTQTTNGSSTAYISGAFGKLTFGDVAGGAGDYLVGQISYVGFTSLGSTNEIGFLPGTATAARYDYTSGNLSFSLGVSQPGAASKAASANKNSIALKYATGAYSGAISYETVQGNNLVSFKGSATFGQATVTLKAAKAKFATVAALPTATKGKTEFGVSLDYKVMPALKLTAYFTDHKNANLISKGIGASYDLGGGASVIGGVVKYGADTIGDVGVTMSF